MCLIDTMGARDFIQTGYKILILCICTCDTHMVHGIQLFICVAATTQTYYIISTLQQVGVVPIMSDVVIQTPCL